MSIISADTPPGRGVEVHGPFLPEYFLTLDGYRVPYITVQPRDGGKWDVSVDNRFMLWQPVTAEELDNWLPILAHAMAVAAGYSSHGEHSNPINPFKVGMSGLGTMKPELSVIDGGKPDAM